MDPPKSVFQLDNAQQAAQTILQQIIQTGGELLYQHYIQERAIPFSIQQTLSVLSNAIQAVYIRHQTGQSSVWQQDQEPLPCKIDTWARNAVPVKRKIKLRPVQQIPSQAPLQTKSIRSMRSSVSRQRVSKQGKIRPSASFQPIEEKVYQTTPILVVKQEISQQEELLRQRKEKQHQRRKNQEERLKKIKEQQEEKQRKLSREAEELKNKPFTYDKQGNIVLINPVKHEKLPPTALSAKPVIQTPIFQQNKPLRKTRKQQPPKSKKTPVQQQDWVKNMTSVQPPIFDTIKLNPGVSISQGTQNRNATITSNSDLPMTRAQYKQISQKTGDSLLPSTPQRLQNIKQSTKQSQDSLQPIQTSNRELLQGIPDYDKVGQILPQQELETFGKRKLVPSLLQMNKITQYGKDLLDAQGLGPVDKFNIEIIRNKNWGVNPPVRDVSLPGRLPKRPSARDLKETHGDILKKPKDQPFLSSEELWEKQAGKLKRPRDRPYIERMERKKHMPPPPLGQTMGHIQVPVVSRVGNSRRSSQS